MKTAIFLVLIAIGAFFFPRFSLDKIYTDLPFSTEVSQPAPSLSSPYRYRARGRQSFVFESADGQTVLKFFNQDYFRNSRKAALRKRFYRESYPLAMRELKEETGLLFLHLERTSEAFPKVVLVGPTGRAMEVDLNRTAFLIQKKAKPYLPHMEAILQNEGTEGLKREIDAWIALCTLRIQKNISDYDHDVWLNTGVIDGKPIYIDPGKFYRNESLPQPAVLKQEWWKATHRLHKWLLKQDPEAAIYLQEHAMREFSASENSLIA